MARWIAPAAALLLLAACAQGPERAWPDPGPLLTDGVTTRDEVFLKLGLPSAVYEGERILTYRVNDYDARRIVVGEPTYWPVVNGYASLVLVFDASGVLRRHSVVRINPPEEGEEAGS